MTYCQGVVAFCLELADYRALTAAEDRRMTEAGLATRIQQMIAEREALGELWGEARAEVRGSANLFLHQVRRRFGPVPTDAEARVRSASVAVVKARGEAMFEAQFADDLFTNTRSN